MLFFVGMNKHYQDRPVMTWKVVDKQL